MKALRSHDGAPPVGYRPSGPLAIQISVVRPVPASLLAAAVRGADVPLRDGRPEQVRHYLPIGSCDYEQALALLRRLASSSRAIQTGRWRAAIVPATGRVAS